MASFISLHDLLTPQVILKAVSRVRKFQGRLGKFLGFQPDRFNPDTVSLEGPYSRQGDTRFASFRLDDVTRVVTKGRAPGTGPASVPPNPVGDVRVSCARFHEKVRLLGEFLGNLSPIIGPNSQIDTGGQSYIARQMVHLAEKFNNTIELMTIGMLQDNLYFQLSGDNLLPTIGAPVSPNLGYQLAFQVPAGNKSQLNLLGTGNIVLIGWQNTSAPIIKNCLQIQAASTQLSGYQPKHYWINSLMWYNILLNLEVRNAAGTVNTPFANFERVAEKAADGMPQPEFAAKLTGLPTIDWHIADDVVITNSDQDPTWAMTTILPTAQQPVYQKVCPDNTVMILPDPAPDWTEIYLGAEYISENAGQPMMLKRGYTFWKEWVTQPSCIELIALMNALPLLYVPKAIMFGTVAGF
jgi:Phage major capsid protein E